MPTVPSRLFLTSLVANLGSRGKKIGGKVGEGKLGSSATAEVGGCGTGHV